LCFHSQVSNGLEPHFIKEPWATPNRATPKSCYPFKQNLKNKTSHKFQKKTQSLPKNTKNIQHKN
jgi:hypothetical protein